VRLRNRIELRFRFGKCDVQARLALLDTLHEELQRERRLADSGIPVDEVKAIAGKAAAEYRVEAADAGRGEILFGHEITLARMSIERAVVHVCRCYCCGMPAALTTFAQRPVSALM
jgi:hypothetical protein